MSSIFGNSLLPTPRPLEVDQGKPGCCGSPTLFAVDPVAISPRQPLRGHRSRAPEFYGFVAWTSTSLLFIVYVLWAVTPDEYIRRLGIIWYPNREWAILLPAYSMMIVLLTYFTYFSLALANTPAFSNSAAFIDAKAYFPAPDAPNPYLRDKDPNAVPEPYDIPIGVVNRVLYSQGTDRG